MQKVEGSSPSAAFEETAYLQAFFCSRKGLDFQANYRAPVRELLIAAEGRGFEAECRNPDRPREPNRRSSSNSTLWLFVLEAEAFAPAGRLIRDVLSKTRGAAVSALIGGYRPMTRSSCRRRAPAGTSAIAASRILVSSGEEARAMRAAAREPSTRWRARGARSRS